MLKLFNSTRGFSSLTKHLISTNKNIIAQKTNFLSTPIPKSQSSKVKISHSYIKDENDLLFNIKLDTNENFVKPSNIICVLDISASMSDQVSDKKDKEASLFTKLDLVKHSINLIISCLRPEDRLSLITFSDNSNKLLDLQYITKNKRELISVVNGISVQAYTNLFSGINCSLQELKNVNSINENTSIFLFTDGLSNINPTEGVLKEFVKLRNSNNFKNYSLHTFGYGYEIDSNLLYNLSKQGNGMFCYIPEYSMCSTSFVNMLAYHFATSVNASNLYLNSIIERQEGKFNFNIGPIQSGQTRNFLLNIKNANPSFRFESQNENIDYNVNQLGNIDQSDNFKFLFFKEHLLKIIKTGLSNVDLKRTSTELEALYYEISRHYQIKECQALLKDIKSSNIHEGQISKAFSSSDYFNSWGINYLLSFSRAHELQVCSNFKDASLQYYGGELFRNLKLEIEEIFSKMPNPQPSHSSVPFTGNFQQNFYDASEPCFDGFGQVYLSNNEKKLVKDLKKGDEIICNDNNNTAKIVCVLKTKVKNGKTYLVEFGDFKITPWHPINIQGKWFFPGEIKEKKIVECNYVYSFVLDKHHLIKINGFDCITLGHNFTHDDVIKHPFFGTNKVIEHLKTYEGYENGLIELNHYIPKYDENGIVCGFN